MKKSSLYILRNKENACLAVNTVCPAVQQCTGCSGVLGVVIQGKRKQYA